MATYSLTGFDAVLAIARRGTFRAADQVGPVLKDIHGAIDTIRSQQETPTGILRIKTFATAGREILAPLIPEYLRRFPGVQIDLVTEGNLVDIVADGFDFGVRSQNLVPTDMIAFPLGPARRYAVVATPACFECREPPQVPADLIAHACIRTRLPNGALFRWQFEADGEPVHVTFLESRLKPSCASRRGRTPWESGTGRARGWVALHRWRSRGQSSSAM